MKKSFLFLFLICFAFKLQAQSYTMSLNIRQYESLSFSLDFFDDGRYLLTMSYHFYNSDSYALHLLSYGDYNLVDDIYTLIDELNKYKIRLKVINIQIKHADETILKTLDGFKWMKNNYFILSDQNSHDNRYIFDEIQATKRDIQHEIERYHSVTEKEYNLSTGIYKSHNMNYSISLNPDNSYSIDFYGYPLSVGKWERNKNVLLLYDTSIEKAFTTLIRKRGMLTSMYLPFEFKMRDFVLASSLN